MKTPAISVIIPVYNSEEYLKRCIESVVNQTLSDIEIILIDDGSSDGSWDIIQKFAGADKRIIAIQQGNSGAAVARNRGLERATGEYIGFVDSDDYVDSNYFEQLYNAARSQGADIARAYVRVVTDRSSDELRKFGFTSTANDEQYFNVELKSRILANKLVQKHVIWLAIFKKKMLDDNSINFVPKLRTGQDVLFNIETSYCANKIVYVEGVKPCYYRVIREGSLMTGFAVSDKGLLSRAEVIGEVVRSLNDKQDYDEAIYIERVTDALRFIIDRLKYVTDVRTGSDIAREITSSWQEVLYKGQIRRQVAASSKRFAELLGDKDGLEEYIGSMSQSLGGVKVTVIVPVYNTEKYLRQCLDSVLGQTLGSIEIICVDDGSTDGSLSILREYASRDNRITILQQKNSGAGAARNKGISKATGRYLYFLDSDDYIEKGLLESVFFNMEAQKAEIAIFRAAEFDVRIDATRELEWVFNRRYIPKKKVFNYKDMGKYTFNTFANVPWNKMYARRFVMENRLLYQEVFRTNDLYFTCKALVLAKRIIAIDNQPFAVYRTGTDSSSQATNDKEPLGFLMAFKALKEFLIEQGIYDGDIKQSFLNHALDGTIYNLNSQKTYQGFKKIYRILKTEDDLLEEKQLYHEGYVYPQYDWALEDFKLINKKSESEYLFGYLQRFKNLFNNESTRSSQLDKLLQQERDMLGEIRADRDRAVSQLTHIQSSRSWRVTRPLRSLASPMKNDKTRGLYRLLVSPIRQVLGRARDSTR